VKPGRAHRPQTVRSAAHGVDLCACASHGISDMHRSRARVLQPPCSLSLLLSQRGSRIPNGKSAKLIFGHAEMTDAY
jgi:hypothetical protein